MENTNPKLIVTGASGFLGGWLAALGRANWEVHAVWWSNPFELPGVVVHRCDLTNAAAVARLFREVRPNAVIHAAAQANLDWCEDHPDEARAVNVGATRTLAELASESETRLVFVSTDMVFDGEKGNYSEDDPVNPISVYGQTKVEAEEVVRAVAPEAAIARTALIFGKPRVGGTSFSEWIEARLRNGKAVPLFTDQYRTPILVQNLSEALLELAGNRFAGTLHLAGTERIDRYTFGLKYARKLGLPLELLRPARLKEARFRAPRPRDLSLDVTRARRTLKTPLLDVDTALDRLTRDNLSPGPQARHSE